MSRKKKIPPPLSKISGYGPGGNGDGGITNRCPLGYFHLKNSAQIITSMVIGSALSFILV